MNTLTYTRWKRQRSFTLMFFLWMNFMDGVDYSATISTVLPYLKGTIKTYNTNLYYALIVTATPISSGVAGILTARYVDQTRRLKTITSILLIVQIFGYSLYMIPFSPYFPFAGRLLSGVAMSLASVFVSEIIRICDSETRNRMMWWLSGLNSIGNIIGPLVIAPFQNVRFNIGKVPVNQYNVAGLILAIATFFGLLFCQIFVYDCSYQLDLKHKMLQLGLNDEKEFENHIKRFSPSVKDNISDKKSKTNLLDSISIDSTGDGEISWKNSLAKLITLDIAFINFSAFLFMYTNVTAEVMLPIVNYNIFNWNLNHYAVINTFYGIAFVAVNAILGVLCTTFTSMYVFGMFSLVLGMLFMLCLQIIVGFSLDTPIGIILMVIYLFCAIFMWCFELIVQRSLLGNMVPSETQGAAEAVRNAFSSAGMILGSLITPLCVHVVPPIALTIMCVLFVLLVVYCFRRRHLCKLTNYTKGK